MGLSLFYVAQPYVGLDLIPAQAPPDDTEFIEVATRPFADVLQMATTGEIHDAMTIIAILLAAQLRNELFHAP